MVEKDIRNQIIRHLMYMNGLRISEIGRLNEHDVFTHEDGSAVIRMKDVQVQIKSPLGNLIKTYISNRKTTTDEIGRPLFVAVGNRAAGKRISNRGLTTLFERGEIVL